MYLSLLHLRSSTVPTVETQCAFSQQVRRINLDCDTSLTQALDSVVLPWLKCLSDVAVNKQLGSVIPLFTNRW